MNSNSPATFLAGDWNAICDVCGHAYKASALRKRWDGAMCCQTDWEPRQPQDFVRAAPDNMSPPWSRPPAADNFAAVSFPITTEVSEALTDAIQIQAGQPLFTEN